MHPNKVTFVSDKQLNDHRSSPLLQLHHRYDIYDVNKQNTLSPVVSLPLLWVPETEWNMES